ncbi:WecB/TagA/CpsF family glycosyltransferase [Synechocystis sp. PCC 7509]|uniref:WecB/TagA/CpsF family glycosyltransferase n=1 Tax=Synechocystis sp. PCC 7509 TaxID=927677 RepID=UPI0002AC40E2|nr:WecB/TagA/CpsF family glycosyltransferase [Synechocystis sp. PCC 7509]
MAKIDTKKLNDGNSQQFLDLKKEDENADSVKPIVNLLGSPVTALSFDTQIKTILEWASNYESRFICVANVHMLMEAYWKSEFSLILKKADMVAPDGMPLVWMMKLMGIRQQNRVAGMDVLMELCRLATKQNISIFFLGSEESILKKMRANLKQQFPSLEIADMVSLPFRPLTPTEDEAIVQKINQSKAKLVLVSLGCPKQEIWMSEHKDKIQAVMIGLGGVFPVLAGIHKKAPLWIQNLGLEWLYRLIQEPRRLWRRYAFTIPPFLWLSVRQLVASKYQAINMLKIGEKS